ncbi:receptor like protein kinase S.2 [Prunus yedoensis var. nudiflora]|nr:receptor like protein kinase S.2 [Prunus yedoensis var. nudiflora]
MMRLIKLGIGCTRSNPRLRPNMRQIVRILDGNDKCFMEEGKKEESMKEWRQMNASSLSLIKRIQALGIQ